MTAIMIFLIVNIYAIYQGFRLLEINLIRDIWADKGDVRQYKYNFKDMFYPSKSNWYGIKYPKNKNYK